MQCKIIVMKVYPILCNVRAQSCMTDMVMLVLQNFVNTLNILPDSYRETCHDENQVVDIKLENVSDIKLEDVTDIQEEEDPVIKAEHEVSYMSVCIHC
jgi:hypothetical protein